MTKILFFFVILVSLGIVWADLAVEKEFSLSYEESGIEVRNVPGALVGVDSFYVDGDNLYLLNGNAREVSVCSISRGKLVRKIAMPCYANEIAVDSNSLYAFTGEGIVLAMDLRNRRIDTYQVGSEARFIQRLYIADAKVMLHTASGNTRILCENGMPVDSRALRQGWLFMDGFIAVGEKPSQRSTCAVIRLGERSRQINLQLDGEIGSLLVLGTDGECLYAVTEILESENPIRVSRRLLCLDVASGQLLDALTVPEVYYVSCSNDLRCIDGRLYKLMLTPEGIDLLRIAHGERTSQSLQDMYPYRYHYNDHIVAQEETSGASAKGERSYISRAQILYNVDRYMSAHWNATSKNSTGGRIITLPDGAKIRTPSWVTPGAHTTIPYKWGGFSTVSTFVNGVASGKYAGSNYTKSVSWSDNYCVGIDCSGFVSRCWNTSHKYGTSTIHQVSSQYSKVSQLRKGDALNKSGSHIVLVIENNPSGTVNVAESCGSGWGVYYRTHNLSSMSGYVPIHYDNVSD